MDIGISIGYRDADLSNPLKGLSTFSDLYIFEPRNATDDNMVISDTVGSAVTMQQTTEALRPTLSGRYLTLGANNNDPRGITTSQSITFKEVFIVCEYTLSTFSNFATLINNGAGAERITGNNGTDDLITTNAIHDTGLIRLNNATETATDILPFNLSVLHSCTDFTTPLDISDTMTIGYNTAVGSRAWLGRLGAVIFSRIALGEPKRKEIVNAMRRYHNI